MAEPTAVDASVPRITLDGVKLVYRGKARESVAVERVDMTVMANSVVSVVGPSGCGKSSLLKVISKVLRPSEGTVAVDGVEAEAADLTGRLSFMFQQPLLLPWRTALDNVLLPLQITHRRRVGEHRAHAVDVLTRVGLGHALDRHPHEMSGGMRQRVALARALVTRPEILLMDEPFGAVDEITRESLQELLLQIWGTDRTTIVLVTHQVEEAVLLSDRVVVMSEGPGTVLRTVEIDLPRPRDAEVRRDPRFLELTSTLRDLLHPRSPQPRRAAIDVGGVR
ncbi:ABC transporter ATP-binding protein [Pseudonocardia xishanensis]|uniref:ABC transporter ATP-binding protein n=1 Tax=Pseudonocardia xishanensis TaxID=630995 RepID=A0ABP8REE7_9PSEU